MKYQEWKWNDNLITNEETVDYQHKRLFQVVNDLINACNQSDTPNGLLVEVALDELLKYAGYHFNDEERIFENYKFQGLEEHKLEHYDFVTLMINFKIRFDKGEEIADELIKFMHQWLINHIMTKDKVAMATCHKK